MSESVDACLHACKYHGPEEESAVKRAAKAYARTVYDLSDMISGGFPGDDVVKATHERCARAYEVLRAALERQEAQWQD